jgi:hypothetical protein
VSPLRGNTGKTDHPKPAQIDPSKILNLIDFNSSVIPCFRYQFQSDFEGSICPIVPTNTRNPLLIF